MLNRRILRAKALQGLYAYYSSQEANYNLALDYISDNYKPDLNSMEVVDRSELNKKNLQSLKSFEQHFKNNTFEKLNETKDEEELNALNAYKEYIYHNQKDFRHFSDNLLKNTEKIYDHYLNLLELLIYFARFEELDPRNKKKDPVNSLSRNFIVQLLQSDENFRKELKLRSVSWEKENKTIYDWYKLLIREDSSFQEYEKSVNPSFETDKKICIHIYRDILFKHDMFNAYMETADINWFEDRHVLKSMVLKTLKNIIGDDMVLNLSVLSHNWTEDKAFFKKLFEVTIQNDKEYEKLIAEKSKNWDIDRIAIMDKIILKMAIGEMIHFPSIPVKVSINEYIELSKNFSTPKSKKFVNGILDVLSEDLKNQGVIKKSGRGLIDNK